MVQAIPRASMSTSKEASTKLDDLYEAIQKGHIGNIDRKFKDLHNYGLSEELLRNRIYTENQNCKTQYDLIRGLLGSELHLDNKTEILQHLLFENDITHYLKNPKVTEQEEDEQRIKIFRSAIKLNNINIIEMLYDFWCNKIHLLSFNDIKSFKESNNIKRVGLSLNEACEDSETMHFLVSHQQLLVDTICLRSFNNFQNELYSQLEILKTNRACSIQHKVDAIILTVSIYNKYSCIDTIRIPKSSTEQEQLIQEILSDENNKYDRALLYVMYEIYFRKLDNNVSSLILNNFNVLKYMDVYNDSDMLQEIECAIYYFLYRSSKGWKLCLSNEQIIKKNILGDFNNNDINLEVVIYKDKIRKAPLLYLEREHYVNILKQLETTKDSCNKTEKKTVDINCLALLPILRDNYLLNSINYMEAVKHQIIKDETGAFEQDLRKIREMFDTLSNVTSALIEAGCSTDVLDRYVAIISALNRIYCQSYKDIISIVKVLNSVLKIVHDINELILNKYLLQHGVGLLDDRHQEILSLTDFKEKDYLEIEEEAITDIQKDLSEMIKINNANLSTKMNTLSKYFTARQKTLQNRELINTVSQNIKMIDKLPT